MPRSGKFRSVGTDGTATLEDRARPRRDCPWTNPDQLNPPYYFFRIEYDYLVFEASGRRRICGTADHC